MRNTKYSCGFFQTIVNCFTQCCQKKPTQNQSLFEDGFADGLFDDSHAETLNYRELEDPRLASKTKSKAPNGIVHIEVPSNQL